jgi:putative FmdB family regulatory protein
MPLYTYECQICGHTWDALGAFTDVEQSCPKELSHRCPGMGKRIPSIPAPATFNCPMPTAPTRHHKAGRKD